MSIGNKVYRAQCVDDSMVWAKENLATAPDGAVFLADELTQAKGRQGRVWAVHQDQLIVTFILKPPQLAAVPPEDLPIRLNQLNMAIVLGILDPLKKYGATLKWPNDFIINHKKVGGMLMHLVWQGTLPIGIIVGFAINVNNEFDPADPLFSIATSLKTVTGSVVDRRTLYKSMLATLNAWYVQWQHGQYMHIYKHWKIEQAYLGSKIQVHQKDGSLVVGVAQQVMPNGDLMLRDEHNKQRTISFFQVEEVLVA